MSSPDPSQQAYSADAAGQTATGWLSRFGTLRNSYSARREIAEIIARIDRELPVAEARADRLLKLYQS
jgi:hypothetical protein